jgi:hypothetical protein
VSLVATSLCYSPEVAALVDDVLVAGATIDYPELGPVDGIYVPRGCWEPWAEYRGRLASLGISWAYQELVRGLVLALDHEPVPA